MSHRTVEKHLERIYQKLGVETHTAAAAKAYEIASVNQEVVTEAAASTARKIAPRHLP